jgi:hypothetical protein
VLDHPYLDADSNEARGRAPAPVIGSQGSLHQGSIEDRSGCAPAQRPLPCASVAEPSTSTLLGELEAVLARLPRLRFGDRCFTCAASCCLRVQAGTYAILLLPGEMFRLIRRYPHLCGAQRFRSFHGIELLMGCGCSPTTSACPIDCCGFDCRVFPLYVAMDETLRPAARVDGRCPLAAEVPPEMMRAVQGLVDDHPRLFVPYAQALAAHYEALARGEAPYADSTPISDERAYLCARGFDFGDEPLRASSSR